MNIQEKIQATSQEYYRRGLSKAGAGDLSRAVEDLEKAVRYDKRNEKARNLLGLVQFQRGELGEAMKHWSISEYLNSSGNWATYYLREIKKEQTLITNMSDSLRLYNEAVELARKDSVDFAIARLKKAIHLNPHYIKAQLLLALCNIEIQHYKTALRVLDQVAKIDPLNPEAMRYRLYIAQRRKEGLQDAASGEIQDLSRDIYVQQALPEPDMDEIFREKRSRKKTMRNITGPVMQILLFFAGVLCCLGFMQTLWYPDEIQDLKNQVQELQISQTKLRNEKDEMQQKIDRAAAVLSEVSQGVTVTQAGSTIQASAVADVNQILADWGQSEPAESGSATTNEP